MTIDFYSAHMETLTELKALADKHNCKLSFGVRSHSMQIDDIDKNDLIKHFNCPEDVAEEICSDSKCLCSFEHYNGGEETYIYFELRDDKEENHIRYNILGKTICENSFVVHLEEYNYLPEHKLSDKTLQWLRENSMNDDNDFIMIDNYESEEVRGFEEIQKEGWCYRTGMILAVFTQLVCDYLGEERIKRTY